MSEEIKKKKKIFEFGILRRVFSYAAPYKRRLYWSIALAILLAVLSPLRPWLIQYTVNVLIRKGLANDVIWMTILQIILLIGETLARFYFAFITAWLGQTVVRDLRVDVYKKVL